jgi:gliding motility-associated-like protein
MNLKIDITLILLVASTFAMAQPTISRLGKFEVDQIKGCAPLEVNITTRAGFVCDGLNPCDMDFENNNQFQSLTTNHIYTQPGTYLLRVLFQSSGLDDIVIVVLPNIQPEFEIYSCGGNEVQVNITDTNYDQYVINYNDASPVVVVPSGALAKDNHTFAGPGNKSITVTGRNLGADDNCNPLTKTVNAVGVLPVPTITQLAVINNSDIQLDFDNDPNILYRLQISTNNATSFQPLQNVFDATTTTVNNLRPDDNFYCFRLGAFDPCNNTTTYSNVICSSNFDLTVQNNLNRLAWATSPTGVVSYAISKAPGTPLSAAPPATSVNDVNVICGTQYCYQQTMNYANGTRSISLSKCGTAISTNTPTPVENISTIVNGGSVELRWTQDPTFVAAEYSLSKSISGSYVSLASSSSTSSVDTDYTRDLSSCYRITYKDACNNLSPASVEACPILLVGTLEANNAVSLAWNSYGGWKDGVDHYTVEKYNEQGQLLATTNTGSNTLHVDNTPDLVNQITIYKITAFANGAGVVPSVSNVVTIVKEPNLFYPTAFTPNGDNLNDIFNVFGQFITSFEMKIFNRWGELMYATDDLDKGWDGLYKGTLMPEGTYVFRAAITDQAGRTFDRSGTVVLLRKN